MNITQVMGSLSMQVGGAFNDYWYALFHPHLTRPELMLGLPVLVGLTLLWGHRQVAIRHSTLSPHRGTRSWSTLTLCGYVALVGFAVNLDFAALGPTVPEASVQKLMQTRNVCVANDSSGSMTAVLTEGAKEMQEAAAQTAKDPAAAIVDSAMNDKLLMSGTTAPVDPNKPMTRIQGAQMATRYLIANRMSGDTQDTDRFCLLRFDDDLYTMAPLTSDKIVAMRRTAHILDNTGGGTNFVTALQKAYEFFVNNTADNSTRVLVINTDGYDAIDPQKRADFIKRYKEAHIKLYVIGIGDGWKEGNTLDLQKFADELHAADVTSGIVYRAANPGQMRAAMEAINKQEKSQEIYETVEKNRPVDYAFILGAIGCVLLFFGFATFAGRVP